MKLKNYFEKTKYNFKRYGFKPTMKKIFRRLFHIKEDRKTNIELYKMWIKNNEPTPIILDAQRQEEFKYFPKISIVVPMYNTNPKFLKELIDSVKNQTYSNWELCLADGSDSQNEEYKKYIGTDKRIKYKYLKKNLGIADNTNKAISMATGDYIAFVDHDDILSLDALYEVAKVINEDRADFIYSDEDKIDDSYDRFEPYFKPDYSPETLECNNYITHLVVMDKMLVDKIGPLNKKYNGAQDFDFILRAVENAKNISHISKILYHWRVSKKSTAYVADAKTYAYEAGKKVIEDYLKRTKREGEVINQQDVPGVYRIKYAVEGNPKVSILIPNKDNIDMLEDCIKSIVEKTTYKNYEIVIIENNSTKQETFDYYRQIQNNDNVKVITYPGKGFNYSSIINFGVKSVDSEYVMQLNNDTKLITGDWLETMIGYAQNKSIGAIGGRLYYEDKTIQHAGIILGLSGIAGNMLVNLPFGKHAYFGREAATRNVIAVTGACLFCRRDLYEEVGYMDENDFKIAFNDVDFCMKLFSKGYRNLYIPYVELFHFESKTRGYDDTKENKARFKEESDKFKAKWKDYIEAGDPYYNKNFSLDSCNFNINPGEEVKVEDKPKAEKKEAKGNFDNSITMKVYVALENFGLWILRKLHLNFLADFYTSHIEGMRYLVCGALSTLVNIVAYALGAKLIFTFLGIESLIVNVSEIFAFIVALIFAYWVNKVIVFNSKCNSTKALMKEITSFVGARIFTEIISILLMNLSIVIGMNDVLMKVIANIIVIILNFVLSKLIIFKK